MENLEYEVCESDMNPSPVWNEGTEAQQEFADSLVEKFCERFAEYLNRALRDELIDETEATTIANNIFFAIDGIDDSRWWCDKKSMSECEIALKLLEDDEDKALVKKINETYNN